MAANHALACFSVSGVGMPITFTPQTVYRSLMMVSVLFLGIVELLPQGVFRPLLRLNRRSPLRAVRHLHGRLLKPFFEALTVSFGQQFP